MLHAERHRRGHRLDAELAEQTSQVRIRDLVEHHESGVDWHRASVLIDRDRVRVPARVLVAVEQGHVEVAMQEVPASKSGDAGSNDGDGRHVTDYVRRRMSGLYGRQ